MIDILQVLNDHNIPYWTEGKNCQKGWVNITCPFCDDISNHGGFNIEKQYYNCWNCGWYSLERIFKNILNIPFKDIIEEYSIHYFKSKDRKQEKKPFSFPEGIQPIRFMHRRYLEQRNFDPDKIENEWKIVGTEYMGDYKYRIIAPIYFHGEIVSYQGRDITDRQVLRYKACPKEKEIIHHKHIVYGIDHIKNEQTIIVEGITDVWRLGKGVVCCFGTSYTRSQLYLLSNCLKKASIIFDNESTAQMKAEKLATELSLLNVSTEIIQISAKDPAELLQEDANYLRKNLLNY